MPQKLSVFGAAILLILLMINPTSALGILKIETPSSATVGEEVQIRIINSLTNEPVQGVTVYINGVKVGLTDENGVIGYVFNSPGVYIIGATKFGYTPALDVSISVEDVSTPVETPVEIPEFEEVRLNGLVIDYIKIDSSLEKLIQKEVPDLPVAGVMVNETSIIVLLGHERMKTGNYIITGYRAGTVLMEKEISLVVVTDYQQVDAEFVPFENLKANPERYDFRLIRTSANLAEIGFLLIYRNIQIGVGTLTDEQIDPVSFVKLVLKDVREFEKDPDPGKARELFGKFSGIPTVRAGHEEIYWKFGRADVTGFVITRDMFRNWAIVNYELDDETLFEYVPDTGFYIVSVEVASRNANVDDIWNGEYNGDIVGVEVSGYGYEVSAKQALVSALAVTGVGAAVAESSPVDILLSGEMMWSPTIPESEKDLVFSVGIRSYEPQMFEVSRPVDEMGEVVRLTGLVVSAKQFNESLPNIPLLLVYDKEFKRLIQPEEFAEDLQTYIEEKTALLEDILIGRDRHKEGTHMGSQLEETPWPHKTPKPETPEEVHAPGNATPLQSLTLEISPSGITANPGDTINLMLRVDWEPKDWKGEADVKIILSAAGFKKEYGLPDVILENPPIEEEFSYTLPDNLPPLTYKATIVVEAGSQKAEDSVQIKVGASGAPGFEVVLGVISLVGAMVLRRR